MTEKEIDNLISGFKEDIYEFKQDRDKFIYDKETCDTFDKAIEGYTFTCEILEKQRVKQAQFTSNGYIVWYECSVCGKQVTAYDHYCKECGQKLI